MIARHASAHLVGRVRRWGLLTLAAASIVVPLGCAGHGTPPGFQPQWDKLVVEVARFEHDQPTGVAVSPDGRVFATFPYWSRRPTHSLAEVMPDGSLRPYPSQSWNKWNRSSRTAALRGFVCAQAVHFDDQGFLWVLDSGNPDNRSGVVIAGPKLFKIDISDDSIAQVYYFDHERDMFRYSYLSDFAIDTKHQYAYITDAQGSSLFVLDMKTRDARSMLVKHESTSAEKDVTPRVGSEQWRGWFPAFRTGQPMLPIGGVPKMGANAIALSRDGKHIYYAPMTGRTLYRMPTELLRAHNATDAELAKYVEMVATLPSTIDGMYMAKDGSLYMTGLEKDAILVRRSDGKVETFVADPRLQWPDSIAMASDGYLYFTTSMTHLRTPYRSGDRTAQPFFVMKASISNVERAAKLQREADSARRLAHDAEARALEAAKRADAKRAVADVQHRVAMDRQYLADTARSSADAANGAATTTFTAADAAAKRQADAAAHAAESAELAKIQAAQSAMAAREAADAAAEAIRKVAIAMAEISRTRAALDAVRANESQAVAARQVHEQALAAAEAARKFADQCQRAADERFAEAAAAAKVAEAAAAAAEREVALAAELTTRATALQTQAVAAATDAIDAELVEINAKQQKMPGAETRTADVPTGP